MRRAGVTTAMALVVALVIGVFVMFGTTAAEAKPGWSSPFRVSSGLIASSMTVAGSPSGAVALWTTANDTLRARRIGRDGSRGPIRVLGRSDTGDGGPWIAIDRRNVAIVVWFDRSDHSLLARRLSKDNRLGPVLRVATPDMTGSYPFRNARVAVDADGDATVVWPRIIGTSTMGPIGPRGVEAGEGTVHARRLTARGKLGPILNLSDGEFDVAPRVAVTPSGTATIAWARMSAGQTAVVTTTIDSQGVVGKVQPVSDPSLPPNLAYESQGLELALDRSGRATFVWRFGETGRGALAARALDADGALSPQQIAASGYIDQSGIRVVVDRLGQATLLWRRGGGTYSIEARQLTASGDMGPTRAISRPSVYPHEPNATVDYTGRVTVVWVSGSHGERLVRSRAIAANGKLARMRTASRRGDLWNAQVVATGPQDLLVAWTRPTQRGSFTEVARSVNRR